jgi:hypothetical protein
MASKDLNGVKSPYFTALKAINIISDTTHGTSGTLFSPNTAKKKSKYTHYDCSGKDNRNTNFCDSCPSGFCGLHKKKFVLDGSKI